MAPHTPKFLADEDLRFAIVSATRRQEPTLEIMTIVEAGCQGYSDEQVLEFASANGLLVVSHDVNTMKSAAESRIMAGPGITGLFLVPQSRPTRPVVESLLLIWSASQAEDWKDRIVYLPL
jgi:hypothetical protein